MRVTAFSVLLGLILRGWASWKTFQPHEVWVGDALVYLHTVEALLRGQIHSELWVWTPGYALSATPLAAVVSAASALLIVSFVCGAAIPALTFEIARRLGAATVGAIAAFFLAVSPELTMASTRPLSETTAIALSLVTLLLLVPRQSPQAIPPEGSPPERELPWVKTVAAGLIGGLACLTRPEALAAMPFFPLLALGIRPRARHFVFVGILGLVILPYVVALHQASGTWAFSLKPAMNLYKLQVYEKAYETGTYYQARQDWDVALRAVSDSSGKLNPRLLAEAAKPYMNLTPGDWVRSWLDHFKAGFDQTTRLDRGFAILGAIGLAIPGHSRARMAFVLFALPFVGVPLFVNPLGRFLSTLFQTHALGLALFSHWLARRCFPTRIPWALALIALVGAAVAFRGVQRTLHEAGDATLHLRMVEIEAAVHTGDFATAERLLKYAKLRYAGGPNLLLLEGKFESARGNLVASEQAFRAGIAAGGSGLGLAEFLMRQGRSAEADSVLKTTPPDIQQRSVQLQLQGHVAFMNGNYSEALAAFQELDDTTGLTLDNIYNVGIILSRLGHFDQARTAFQRVVAGEDSSLAGLASSAILELERVVATPENAVTP